MLIVKIMAGDGLPDDDPRATFMLFADVRSVTFTRAADGSCMARMYVLDEVKTATVPGFSEHEVNADVRGNVYVLNDRGRTVETFNGGMPVTAGDLAAPGQYAGLAPRSTPA